MEYRLKDLVENEELAERMNKAFSDLRADYELGIDISKEKIEELKQTNVDINNHLQSLISYSKQSSGIISGLRGTGKTHLMLLAHNAINEEFLVNPMDSSFCLYLNAKRFTMPNNNCDSETFERAFSLFIYDEFSSQLKTILKKMSTESILKKIIEHFTDSNKKMFVSNIEAAMNKILEFRQVIQKGTDEFEGIYSGSFRKDNFEKDIESIATTLKQNCGINSFENKMSVSRAKKNEVANKISQTKDIIAYLNHNTVRKNLLEVIELLNIRSLVIYVDEWEKLYFTKNLQTNVATYINHIIDNPIYFWLGVVPNRGGYAPLVVGADLQHTIKLDETLIFENSSSDKIKCINYFKEFINKRLNFCFRDSEYKDQINDHILFNKPHNLELLVLASMGNSRDFGTMLLYCWNQFQSYRKNGQYSGAPYQYIAEQMIISAIKYNGEQKRLNISENSSAKTVWNNISEFCISKKSSHFVIEESAENNKAISNNAFSDLFYNRLIHFRKSGLTQKDGRKEKRVSLYALDYASVYDLHANRKQITFITNSKEIHNSVRRYVYNPQEIINKLQIENGEIFPCKSCHQKIDVNNMKAAWEHNSCPYCGNSIY